MPNPRVEGNSGVGLTSAADINDGGQRWKWTYGDPLTRQARGRSPQAEISPAMELLKDVVQAGSPLARWTP